MSSSRTILRNASVATTIAALVIAGLAVADNTPAHASTSSDQSATQPSDRWLQGLTGKHRQLFDAPQPNGGIGLIHILNYYDTYNKAYGVKDADIDAVLTYYGGTTLHALNDAAWAKYQIGEFLGVTDPATGANATSNPWRTAPVILGMTIPAASIESLRARGVTQIVCNNALQVFSGMLASKRGLEAGVVYEDLKANILPGIQLVPAMVIAIEQATRAGLSYQRQ